MLDDGNCKVAPSSSNGFVADARRPEGDIVITASVGQGGANRKDDVFNIQYGLN